MCGSHEMCYAGIYERWKGKEKGEMGEGMCLSYVSTTVKKKRSCVKPICPHGRWACRSFHQISF